MQHKQHHVARLACQLNFCLPFLSLSPSLSLSLPFSCALCFSFALPQVHVDLAWLAPICMLHYLTMLPHVCECQFVCVCVCVCVYHSSKKQRKLEAALAHSLSEFSIQTFGVPQPQVPPPLFPSTPLCRQTVRHSHWVYVHIGATWRCTRACSVYRLLRRLCGASFFC